jgi:heptosyltransferase-2
LLVRGVNWLGDAVMTTPALMRLREALPDTHIALLTRAKLTDLWRGHPAVNEVIPIPPGESVWSVGGRLRAGGFDTVLVLPNSPRSAIEVWLARIPRRIGYARPWRNGFLTEAIPTRPGHVKMHKRSVAEVKRLVKGAASSGWPAPRFPMEAHQTQDYLHLATALGASPKPIAPVLAMDRSEVEAAGAKFDLPAGRAWLGLNAGAEYGPAKRWPKDRFVAAVKAIHHQTGCGCLVFGGPGDAAVADEIAVQLRAPAVTLRNLAGRTSLRELMALLTHCRVLLTNDTGPMHVAAALGVPVVVPFGSTSPELTGPGLAGDPRHRWLRSGVACAPCFRRACPIDFRCMGEITVGSAVDAVTGILAAKG